MINGLINEELKKSYGVTELNTMPDGYHDEDIESIDWEELKDRKNVMAERIRFVGSPGFPAWDCSYFHVRIDGKKYDVLNHPFSQIPRKTFQTSIYAILKSEKIFIKNFFDRISTLM